LRLRLSAGETVSLGEATGGIGNEGKTAIIPALRDGLRDQVLALSKLATKVAKLPRESSTESMPSIILGNLGMSLAISRGTNHLTAN
jgi:hypothetical protein